MSNQTGQTRRRFLGTSGAVLGGVLVGSTVTSGAPTDRYIVKTKKADRADVEVVHDLSAIGYAVGRGEKAEAEKLGQAAPDVTLQLDEPLADEAPTLSEASPADEPYYDAYQWDKQALDLPEAHDVTQGEGSRIAIVDSGVAAGHPDLDVNTDLSRDFTGDGYGAGVPAGGDHGTHVAGIAAALDNEEGIAGTAPETDLVDCRVFSQGPGASFGDILAAVLYAAEIDADAANLSIGAYAPREDYAEKFGRFYGRVLNKVMTYANKEGTLLVISAGNDGANLQNDKKFLALPVEGAQALGVSATGPIGYNWGEEGLEEPPESPAFYTNYGTNAVTIGAPGGDADLDVFPAEGSQQDLVFSTIATPEFADDGTYEGATYDYGWKAGTSMAAPQVTGAAALVKSENSGYNANQLESSLKRAASVPDGYDKSYYGSGFLDIVGAL